MGNTKQKMFALAFMTLITTVISILNYPLVTILILFLMTIMSRIIVAIATPMWTLSQYVGLGVELILADGYHEFSGSETRDFQLPEGEMAVIGMKNWIGMYTVKVTNRSPVPITKGMIYVGHMSKFCPILEEITHPNLNSSPIY